MKKFYITTDSGCDLSMDVCKARDILPIGIDYILDGVAHTDTMNDNDTRTFYDLMRQGAMTGTTQLNTSAFTEFWEPLLADNIPIVHLSVGSGVSGTCNNAMQAAQALEEKHPGSKIYVFDSTAGSLGLGMLVLFAARLRDRGFDAEQCMAWLKSRARSINVFFTTDDLQYLQRGGRVSRIKAACCSALNINPILHLNYDGCLRVCDKARGRESTLKRIMERIKSTVLSPKDQTLYVAHSDNIEKAREYGEAAKKLLGFKDIYYSYIGPVVGAHAGPGLIACFYLGKDRPVTE